MTLSRFPRSLGPAAALAAAIFFAAGCGGGSGGEGEAFTHRLEPAGANRLFLHGEEVPRGTWIEADRGGALRIGGRRYAPPFAEPPVGAEEAARLYGEVPSVREAVRAGASLPEAAARFRGKVRRMRAATVRAWRAAKERGAGSEEAAGAAAASIGPAERALLAGEPSVSPAGILSLRFRGRPPELWALGVPETGGAFRDERAREFARRLVRFLEGDSPRVVHLGDGVRFLDGEEAEDALRERSGSEGG